MAFLCQPNNATTTTRTEIPEPWATASRDAIDLARGLAQRPYQKYPGGVPRIAQFSPEQNAAMTTAMRGTGSWAPQFDSTMRSLSGKSSGSYLPMSASSADDYLAMDAPSADAIGAYVNPEMAAIEEAMQRSGQKARSDFTAKLARSGGMGGSRQAIMEAAMREGEQRNLGQLRAQSWQGARDAVSRDRQSNQAAREAAARRGQEAERGNQAAYEAAARRGLTADELAISGLDRGSQMFGRDISTMLGVGGAKQAQDQRNLDLMRSDWQAQQEHPIDMLNLFTSVLRNTPYPTSRTTTGPGPNSFAQNVGGFASLVGAGAKVAPFFFGP